MFPSEGNRSTVTIYEKIRAAVEAIQARSALVPEIGVVLGSGMGSIANSNALKDAVTIPYREIPYFHGTTVEGHAGQLVLGYLHGVPAVLLQGRCHLYEGYSVDDVVFPTRVISALGIHTLLLTNSSGGVNTAYRPGDLVLIRDHINLMGDNPLKGSHLGQLGPRFPDLSEAYHPECVKVLKESAESVQVSMHDGVYAGVLGPTYETPAEVRMLRVMGADIVGMSTVPESIAANHLGVRVLGLSCVANLASGVAGRKLSHAEVLESAKTGAEKMGRILEVAVPKLTSRRGSKTTESAVTAKPHFAHSQSLAKISQEALNQTPHVTAQPAAPIPSQPLHQN
ncbi:MAG: purine-nucleoside phosphorylase [Bdellovibrionales bacterium]|nr:purine-nucleoside phosphorylase [Bdellovibrionales bacterium]